MEMIQPILALMMMGIARGFTPLFPEAWAGPLAVGAYLAIGWAVTRHDANRSAARVIDTGELRPDRGRGALHLAAWGMVLFGSGWLGLAWGITGGTPGLAHAFAFSPYVAHRAVRCFAQWPLEACTAHRPWARRDYVVFHIRVLMLAVVPILIAQTLLEILQTAPGISLFVASYEMLVVPGAAAGVLAVVFICAPLLIRFILGARSLEPGPVRTRLEAYGKRTGFRPNDILVWQTGNAITNALYIGIVPCMRYVVVTDALLSKLDPEQVEAVYAHEAGHGARHHTLLFMLLAIGLVLGAYSVVLAMGGLLQPLLSSLDPEVAGVTALAATIGVYVALLALFFLVGMGWLSRRFETEADLHAVLTMEDPAPFVGALEAVGLHMGALKAGRSGMRHFGIGTRIGLVNRYTCEPDFRASFDRLLRRCRWGIVAILVLSAIPILAVTPQALVLGHFDMRFGEAREIENKGRRDEAKNLYGALSRSLQESESEHPGYSTALRVREVAALASLADVHLKDGDYGAASKILADMDRRVRAGDTLGSFNTRNLRVILGAIKGEDVVDSARDLIVELGGLMTRYGWNPSIDQTYTDLFLVLRASGSEDEAPGSPEGYSAMARLLFAFDPDLIDAAREDVARNAYRRELLKHAAPTWLEKLQ
ncbi:MAG: M48 family metalloprotease [Planctomycetes bacterium]|nr:M48 family metalloprotease [Planctomycetota bacterium]